MPQTVVNSPMSSSFGNSSNSVPGNAYANLGRVSGDVNIAVLNSVASSGPSVGATSLVTDANSGLSGGMHLQRSASVNTESYMRLPTSPMSFSSNNISISGSSILDGSSVVQQSSNQDSNSQQVLQNQQGQGASSATSLPTARMGKTLFPTAPRVPGSFIAEHNISHLYKKPRLDIKQEDSLQQQVVWQSPQRQDSMQLNPNTHFQTMIQQQRQRQQLQQLLQSMPPEQRAHFLQQQQLLQLRHQLHPQGMQSVPPMKYPYDGSVCARRIMQYLYHQRQRPLGNSIAYWRKFVSEYYSPHAKKRWCLSLYENVGQHSLGLFAQTAMDAWQCDIYGCKSGRGFEATFDILPRLYEIKFSSGVIDELLFLDLPSEHRFPNGIMMLDYGKAVQESVYEQLRVVHEGRLRIIFSPDLKILSLEFCARRHEELLPRRLVAPQVNQFLQIAQKCQSAIAQSRSDGISPQDLQTNSNMVITAGSQLARSLELQSLNDLGYSKRYVRCLQISEVVNSMKDLMDFCREHKIGPVEGVKKFSQSATAAKVQLQKIRDMEHLAGIQGVPTDNNMLNKVIVLQPGNNGQVSNNQQVVGHGTLTGSAQASLALTNYQNLLLRQNSLRSNLNPLQQEASSSFINSNLGPSSTLQSQTGILPGTLQNLTAGGFSSSHLPRQQPQLSANNGLIQQNPLHPSQGSQSLQQQMMQRLLQDMNNRNSTGAVVQQQPVGNNASATIARDGMRFGNNTSAVSASAANGTGAVEPTPSGSNSLKASANSYSSAACNSSSVQKPTDMPQNLQFSDEMVQKIVHEFTDDEFFTDALEDSMNYSWKV